MSISNFAGWINFRKLISTLYLFASLSPTYVSLSIFALYHMHFRHYSLRIKISFKIFFSRLIEIYFFRVPWNFLNNIWTTPVVPWNSTELTQQNFKLHGIPWILSRSKVPWNSMDFFSILTSSMEFHGTRWIWYLKKWYFLKLLLVFNWWLYVILLKSQNNATYCIGFNIVIVIFNTPVACCS